MKRLHKINLIILSICTVCLVCFITFSRGFHDPSVVVSDIGMLTGMAIITILYFSKANDIIKGTGITVIIAIACQVTSILQGGSDATFVLSFIMLGMALLYFNKTIIISYLVIYIPICIVTAIVNPEYVLGPGASLTQALENIFAYTVVGVLMVIATGRGGRLMASTNQMLETIQSGTKKTTAVIQKLNESMEESSQNIGVLTDQIQGISDATTEIESLTKAMSSSADALSTLVSQTVDALGQNVELNKELENQFKKVGMAVQNGSDGALEVKSTLDTMKETVLAAGESTEVLLGKISLVNRILKEINKITMRTNMLSINASIEAAKAGANGKGFAVVANEIKSLADESSESAKGIQQIIAELSSQVDEVAAKTSAGTKSAIAGMESMESLLGILSNIKEANDIVASVVSRETQTNDEVNFKFESVSSEIGSLVADVISISDAVGSVSSDIHSQNISIKNVNQEIGKMKIVVSDLSVCEA